MKVNSGGSREARLATCMAELEARVEELETALKIYAGYCDGVCCEEEYQRVSGSCGFTARAALEGKK